MFDILTNYTHRSQKSKDFVKLKMRLSNYRSIISVPRTNAKVLYPLGLVSLSTTCGFHKVLSGFAGSTDRGTWFYPSFE